MLVEAIIIVMSKGDDRPVRSDLRRVSSSPEDGAGVSSSCGLSSFDVDDTARTEIRCPLRWLTWTSEEKDSTSDGAPAKTASPENNRKRFILQLSGSLLLILLRGTEGCSSLASAASDDCVQKLGAH